MLTDLGKFLRKLRIDQGEILIDMANKLCVTASFLSSVENGKKHMPSSWNNRICTLYDLTDAQRQDFTTAIAKTESAIEMDFSAANIKSRELAVSFARKFQEIDQTQIDAITKILTGEKHY